MHHFRSRIPPQFGPLLALACVITGCASYPSASSYKSDAVAFPALAFTGVAVVDVVAGHVIPAQTVIVVGTRVQALGPAKQIRVPPNATVVDARGTYMIPGLWDMHAHVDQAASRLYPLFIANGVTGVREMAQRFPFGADSFRVWQRQVAAGLRVGPRVVGPSADLTYGVSINTPADAPRVVDSLKAAGIQFLKVHNDMMSRELYFAVADAARRAKLPFVGHIPVRVTEIEAADHGQLSVEHVEENHSCWPNWPKPLDSLAVQRCAPIGAAYVRHNVWMVPTLAGAYYVDHNIQEALQFVRMMHGFGVRMLTGTDFGLVYLGQEPRFRPGGSLLDEVVLLVDAGLTPAEALRAGTLNPAEFFHLTDSLGTVTAGKLADLVLLEGNPLKDIHHITHIRAVVANGRYFDRRTLDALLAPAQRVGDRLQSATH